MVKKRGQTEIIGLAVIVILIIVIGLIFLKLKSVPKQDVVGVARTSIKVSNLLNAAMKYTLPNCEESLADAAKKCVGGDTIICGKSGCDQIEDEFEAIAEKVLSAKECYELTVKETGEEDPEKTVPDPLPQRCVCPGADKIPQSYRIPGVTIRLTVWNSCK